MAINFDQALGIHPQALAMHEKRSEVIGANLANTDTANYKARDIDFKSLLKQSMSDNASIVRTQTGHFGQHPEIDGRLMYRNPTQASLDGNTVEEHSEQARYAENAVQYQASLSFISGKFSDLMTALRGQ